MAFSSEIDRASLFAIEQSLGDRTEPCVVSDDAMENALAELRREPRPSELVFDTLRDVYAIAHAIREYCVKFRPQQMRLSRPGKFLWVRLSASGRDWDLLFRIPG